MLKINVSHQANILAASHITQHSSLQISIKSIFNKALSKNHHILTEKSHRLHQGLKEHETQRMKSTSSNGDSTTVNLAPNDSIHISVESSSELNIKGNNLIPPAPPLPGHIPPAPPLPIPNQVSATSKQLKQKTETTEQSNNDRSKLLEEIRQGVKLKPSASREPSTSTLHSQLMKELITHGTKLNKISPDISLQQAASANNTADSHSALLSEISAFSKDRLRKTDSAETLNISPSTITEPSLSKAYELLLSDEMFTESPKLSDTELNDLANAVADYLFKAADIDWMQVISEQTRNLTQTHTLKADLKQAPQYIQAFCAEVLKFPDCYKSADVSSPETSQTKEKSIIDVALQRLQAGRNRLFSTTDAKGINELKKGEAILESAINAARAIMTSTEKSALLSNNIKSAMFKVFSELPCMDGFTEQNGKSAYNALRLAFYRSIQNSDTAKQDITKFMKTNLADGFSGYSYTGLTNRIAQLEALLASLTEKEK
ncbi:hypothetical protein ETN89_21100 (plasmid) [Photobacterium damselae subsp. damselae]|uniref:WH2 domain-containing protein n=1 Tax=Photobacterium damselae TaxID=38293 RepID=UPI000A2FC14E|nr:WH2 domain-containing protein [Photobacterium damselae]ARR51724.1 hypothetical protein CAY62_20100 [Photobacterium damselae subsp. damselae]QAY37710.1 hypothetical protein ETN89_21100 [Photobacterium damselae subsp. damselae]